MILFMCGRFTQIYTWRELYALYRITEGVPARSNLEPRYNIGPTTTVHMVMPTNEGRALASARWGLVPAWWKKELRELPSTINARAETVAEKPMFRSAFRSRRCVIPARGFYEWTGPKGAKQPHYIKRVDGQPLCLAGLWEEWRHPETAEKMLSTTIIVCAANRWMSDIHDRMPVILEQEDVDAWLEEPRTDLLVPTDEDRLQQWLVTPQMNSTRYQEPDSVDPLSPS